MLTVCTVECSSFHVDRGNGEISSFGTYYRPHLKYFLEEASKQFEIIVFTASNKVYAAPLLDKLDPDGNLIQYFSV